MSLLFRYVAQEQVNGDEKLREKYFKQLLSLLSDMNLFPNKEEKA
jgi:hypothetical protein